VCEPKLSAASRLFEPSGLWYKVMVAKLPSPDRSRQVRLIWGDEMPRFMDFHDDLKLPPEAIEQIAQGTRDGAADEFGVRQIELYHNADGKVYCLLEGPDEEAIRRHHAALDVPCGEVHEVNSLL
jgi:hypothetical protein